MEPRYIADMLAEPAAIGGAAFGAVDAGQLPSKRVEPRDEPQHPLGLAADRPRDCLVMGAMHEDAAHADEELDPSHLESGRRRAAHELGQGLQGRATPRGVERTVHEQEVGLRWSPGLACGRDIAPHRIEPAGSVKALALDAVTVAVEAIHRGLVHLGLPEARSEHIEDLLVVEQRSTVRRIDDRVFVAAAVVPRIPNVGELGIPDGTGAFG